MIIERPSMVLPYDIDEVRADFPILHQEHSPGKPLVYLDNAASSQKSLSVIESMSDYYLRYNANVHRGIHKLSEEATSAYEGVRKNVKRFINADNHREVIFVRGTTEAFNLVAQTWGRANLQAGDVVLSTQMEHHANIVPWQMLAAEKGIKVLFAPITEKGMLDMDAFAEMLHNNPVKLVTLAHASNVLGTVNPIAEIARLAHDAGALIFADAAQSVPHMPVDVQELDVDFLAFSGHKMIGPTGIGVLYGKRHILEEMPPWLGGGDMIASVTFEGSTWNDLPHKFEAGTPSIAEVIGLGAAVDYLTKLGMENIHEHEKIISGYALERLVEIPGVTVYGAEAEPRGALAAFTDVNIHPHDMAQILDSEGVAVRAGHHCAQPLHSCYSLSATTRASFYLYNKLEEVDSLVEAIYKAKKIFAR